jgi:hypothetical protein
MRINPRLARVARIIIHQPDAMAALLQSGYYRLQILLDSADQAAVSGGYENAHSRSFALSVRLNDAMVWERSKRSW